LVDGIAAGASGPGASRRPILFPKEPAGWAALLQNADYKTRLEKADAVVLWPGKPGVAATAVATPLTGEQQARFTAGKALFASVCAACHQVTGRGRDGLAPPLLDSDWVLGNPEALVRVVMHGVSGAITVNGREYIGEMPGLGALGDSQMASVLTYLRREWGHTAAPVDPEQVSAIRVATVGRATPFGWRELTPFRR
jgi:mono/diheme cytochrome c family protein